MNDITTPAVVVGIILTIILVASAIIAFVVKQKEEQRRTAEAIDDVNHAVRGLAGQVSMSAKEIEQAMHTLSRAIQNSVDYNFTMNGGKNK